MFDFSNYYAKSKFYDDSNVFVVGKMKDKMGDVPIEQFFELKQRIHSTLVTKFLSLVLMIKFIFFIMELMR